MPQIMIDTLAASPAHMRATAKFLEQMADLAQSNASAAPSTASHTADVPAAPAFGGLPLPAGASVTPPAPLPPAPPPPVVPSGTVQVPPPPQMPTQTATTAAPPSAPTTSPAPAGAVELDSEGFPYDERIHSAGDNRKKKTGEWKYRRGCEAALIQTVEAELRAKGFGVKATGTPPPPPAQQSFVPPPPPPSSVTLPAAGPGFSPPPPPVAGALPAGATESPAEAFRKLMQKIAPHMAPNGKLALSILTPIYQKLGVKGLEDFAKPGAPVAAMNAEVDAILGVA